MGIKGKNTYKSWKIKGFKIQIFVFKIPCKNIYYFISWWFSLAKTSVRRRFGYVSGEAINSLHVQSFRLPHKGLLKIRNNQDTLLSHTFSRVFWSYLILVAEKNDVKILQITLLTTADDHA